MSGARPATQSGTDDITPVVSALFRYANPDSYVALRCFPQHDKAKPATWLVDVGAGDLAQLVAAIGRGIHRAARATDPEVFAPVTGATFNKSATARTRDLAQGLAIAVEIDSGDTAAALTRLEMLIGPATMVVHSGGLWVDPTTGEIHPKLHAYWRLSEPTTEEADHILLHSARRDAAILAGADMSGTPIVHCFRWPGSLNRKDPDRPTRCILQLLNGDAEVHLIEAAETLALAVEGAGLKGDGRGNGAYQDKCELQADPALVAAAMACIPNPDLHYAEWVRWAYAVAGATAGAGFDIFAAWSRQSAKHNDAETKALWNRVLAAKPTRIGAGSIFAEARRHGWIDPRSRRWTGATQGAAPNKPTPGVGASQRQGTGSPGIGGAARPAPRRRQRADQPPYTPADPGDTWDPWEDPAPPAWPSGILSREAEDTLALVSLRDGIDIGTLAMAIIAATSAAAPKNARFFPYNRRESGWSVPPIFWLMLIGDSGRRKIILNRIAFDPLRQVQNDVWRPYTTALRAWKRTAKERGEKPEEPHSFVVDDITPEKLTDILGNTTRGTALFKDELAGLFEFGRYRQGKGEAARALYLSAYEDEPSTVHRMGRDSQNIEHTGLSIFGGIQPARLDNFQDLANDGLMQRFAPLRTPPTSAARPEIDIGAGLDDLHRRIAALCKLDGRNYTTTPEGTALIQATERAAFGYATITDFSEGWPGFCHKLHGTHARLALILQLMETPETPIIATATVERAHRLVHRFVLQHARDFYTTYLGGNQDRLRDIAGWLLTREDPNAAPDQGERIVASDLTSNCKSCRSLTSKGIAEVLDPFVTRGWLQPETDYPGNRAWFFNPAIRDHLAERQQAERERRANIRKEIEQLTANRNS